MQRAFFSRQLTALWLGLGLMTWLGLDHAEAQLRPIPVRKSKADRAGSSLVKEDGAIYLEGLVKKEIKVRVTQAAPIYANLTGERWLGNLFPNQEVTLLALGEKAYRVRGQAKQGQVAGWIGKAMIEGLDPELEQNLGKLHERQLLVDDLIDQQQVALGMTVEEVIESLGDPDKRNTKVDKDGRNDTLEYIKYQKVPQTQTAYDQFGRPYQSVTYVLVETGKATISFEKGVVSAIEESEGLNLQAGAVKIVPPPIILF
ncbi:MAG: hypothetical protein KDM64_18000 [Verrucomicrobiae bacterium]|nr:hypothetical protein [Verrucomicrobiae bacterium]MCB1093315.1 hypothetical protein [Verrucomicrobiae bacterium]